MWYYLKLTDDASYPKFLFGVLDVDPPSYPATPHPAFQFEQPFWWELFLNPVYKHSLIYSG